MLIVSATMPWPAKAASPCRRTGRTLLCTRSSPEARLLRADHALDDGIHGLEVARVRGERDVQPRAAGRHVRCRSRRGGTSRRPSPGSTRGPPRPRTPRRSCPTGLPTVFARTVSRPRCDMPMTASPRPASAARSSRRSRSGIAASPPSSEKRFWPTYFVWRNFSKLSASTSFFRMRRRSSAVEDRAVARRLHAVDEPLLLRGILVVHELGADLSAVRLAQDLEDLAQRGPVAAAEAVRDERPVEVPQREAVRGRVEVGVVRHRVAAERVQVRHEVAAHAVRVDELQDARLLLDGLEAPAARGERRRRVLLPAHRPVRHLQVREDALVEAVAAEEEILERRR